MLINKRFANLLTPSFSAALLLILLIGSAMAVSTSVQELALNNGGLVREINVTEDRNLWITDFGANELRFIDVDNSSYLTYTNINGPVDARFDGQDSVWWTYIDITNKRGIGQLDIKSETVSLWPLPDDSSPNGTAIDDAGRVWITNSSDPLLHRFELSAKELCSYTVPVTGSGGSDYILFNNGDVWLGDSWNEQIIRFSPDSRQYTSWPLEESALPVGLTFDEGNNIWWADSTLNHLGRLNPATNLITTYAVPTDSIGSSVPVQVAARDGKIWFTDSFGGRVGYIDPLKTMGSPLTVAPATKAAAEPQCKTIEPVSTTPANSTSGDIQWADNAYEIVKDSGDWRIYQLPENGTPWGIAADANNVWLADQIRQMLGRFELRKCYQLSANKFGSGSLPQPTPVNSIDCPKDSYIQGDEISLLANPAMGWQVKGWSGTDNDASTATTNSVTMPEKDHVVSVSYVPIPPECYSLSLSHTGSGTDPGPNIDNSVSCQVGDYIEGQVIYFTASPAPFWQISGWSGTDDDSSKGPTNVLTMPPANHTVTVRYEPIPGASLKKLFLPITSKFAASN